MLATAVQAAPRITYFRAVRVVYPDIPEWVIYDIQLVSTQAAGKVLTLEYSRDGGATWEFTGNSAGVYFEDTTIHFNWRLFDAPPTIGLFRTVEH